MISHLPRSGRPFKLTREMLDAIKRADEAGGGDPACENAGQTWFQDLDAHALLMIH